jgi:hypothetical protein
MGDNTWNRHRIEVDMVSRRQKSILDSQAASRSVSQGKQKCLAFCTFVCLGSLSVRGTLLVTPIEVPFLFLEIQFPSQKVSSSYHTSRENRSRRRRNILVVATIDIYSTGHG